MIRLRVREGAAALALVLAAVGTAATQEESGAFVVTIGRDTLAVERYTRTADSIMGEVVSRSPSTVERSYKAWLRPDGSIARLEMTSRSPARPGAATTFNVELTPEGATSRIQNADSTWSVQVAGANPLPLVGFSHALYEQALIRSRAARLDSATYTLVPPGSRQVYALTLRLQADSATITNIAGKQHVAIDARGRLLGLNGLESTQKFIVTRVPTVDVAAMSAEFARRDAAGQGVGPLSPRDSAVADVGGAHLAIDYGRPFKRGRRIMGEVVPWNQVWRTGANAATGFTTTRDLVIGGTTVPAGKYTLWTLPSESGWKLIVNRQTGQWGTEYDAEQDLARIDMQTRRLDEPVEKFTIVVEPSGDSGGVLRLSWDDLEAFVPFTVR